MINTLVRPRGVGIAVATAAVFIAVALTVDPEAGAVLGFTAATRSVDPPLQIRPDGDGDGLYDDDETDVYGTDPGNADTDGDGADDGQEVYDGTNPLVPNGSVVVTTPPPRTTERTYQTTQTYRPTPTYRTTQTYRTTETPVCNGGGVWPDCLH